MPVIINHSFLDAMEKIIPNIENAVNVLTIKAKFALGPLMIK